MSDLLPKPVLQPDEIAPETAGESAGDLRLQISNALVQLQKRRYGRGPTKARVHLAGDLVLCNFEGGFLTPEKTLADAGQAALAAQYRATLDIALKNEFIDVVERTLTRQVRSFMSASDIAEDVSVAIFVLEPERIQDQSVRGA